MGDRIFLKELIFFKKNKDVGGVEDGSIEKVCGVSGEE